MKLRGNLVDVELEEIYPAELQIKKGRIRKIKKIKKKFDRYLLPGFIDAHIHIESSLLCPSRFAEASMPCGTTAVVCDPHEIANVAGIKGLRWFRQASSNCPLKFWLTAPSCVPSSKYEQGGAFINAKKLKEILDWKETVALGELMDIEGLLRGKEDLLKKIDYAKKLKKPVNGHAPSLQGRKLEKYVAYGISSDHESSSLKEAKEKLKLGLKIGIREGSAAKNLKSLVGLDYSKCFLCSDDLKASELLKQGHLNKILRKAVAQGIDSIKAIKMVTINPALHYGLDAGILKPGMPADLAIVDNLKNFSVKQVFINGKEIAKKGKSLYKGKPQIPKSLLKTFRIKKKTANDLSIPAKGKKAKVKVIEIQEGELLTKASKAKLPIEEGKVKADPSQDIIKICVADRYGRELVGKGFVKGFGLKRGALASSVAHDSHNIVATGLSGKQCARAINEIASMKGGLVVCDKERVSKLKLPIAGLMSTKPAKAVAEKLQKLKKHLRANGCKLASPFMQLSFLSLPVIPELRLTPQGLFDVKRRKFSKVII